MPVITRSRSQVNNISNNDESLDNSINNPVPVKCGGKRCMTCPKRDLGTEFVSNITKNKYKIINHSNEQITCHSQNLIYLLTCNKCNSQYVGQTCRPLHKRMNIHRTAKTGCEHMLHHFRVSCPGAGYSIMVIEVFEGSGYQNNKECPDSKKVRLDREDYWIKELRTVFPYGLNSKIRGLEDDVPVGTIFPSIPRSRTATSRPRENRNNHAENSNHITSFDFFHDTIANSPSNLYNTIRVHINRLKKKTLKNIASEILTKGACLDLNAFNEKVYSYILDIIDTKLYKPSVKNKKPPPKYVCTVFFDNKAVEYIQVSKLLNHPDLVPLLPNSLQDRENRPVVTYKLGPTIRSKIFNYRQTVESIFVDDEVSFTLNSEPCNCAHSKFCDPDHKHVITGDLRLVENEKLRKLLSKGPNFREPKSLNFHKASVEIMTSINNCIENIVSKTSLSKNSFKDWKDKFQNLLQDKIKYLSSKIKPQKTNPILKDPAVLEYLNILHTRYVIVPIDKASNNFAFICKKFYIDRLLKEVSHNNPTYSLTTKSKDELVNKNIKMCEDFGLDVSDKQKDLPSMHWIPKMHKSPVGARFIVASKTCSTKPLTEVISRVFKMLFNHVQNFHRKSRFYTSYNHFWVVQNSFPIIEKLEKINSRKNAKKISTFDFSTLYTTIPHNLLTEVLAEVISLVFQAKKARRHIGFSKSSVYWTPKGVDNRFFSCQTLIETVEYLIRNCYFTVGNQIFKQDIGIPMGIDPAPFWANLFLYFYESKYIKSLISEGSTKAFHFHSIGRFIDDLCAINDRGSFSDSYKDIYPQELELKLENHGDHATFLDLDIRIADGLFVYRLFDKRDAFPFFIVRMPHLSSNIPSSIFYSSIYSELLRIARCTLYFTDFISKATQLLNRMSKQGGIHDVMMCQLRKAVGRYPEIFRKYGKSSNEIVCKFNANK